MSRLVGAPTPPPLRWRARSARWLAAPLALWCALLEIGRPHSLLVFVCGQAPWRVGSKKAWADESTVGAPLGEGYRR